MHFKVLQIKLRRRVDGLKYLPLDSKLLDLYGKH
jgi:hypothetical protein